MSFYLFLSKQQIFTKSQKHSIIQQIINTNSVIYKKQLKRTKNNKREREREPEKRVQRVETSNFLKGAKPLLMPLCIFSSIASHSNQ